MRRMIGAAKLDVPTYEEVEADTTATGQAMGVVLLASLASAIGSGGVSSSGFGIFLISGIAALFGWVAWAFITYIIGTRLFAEPQTSADTGELMRTLGFAQAPALLRIFGLLPGIGSFIIVVTHIWLLISMVIAVRQALDYTSTLRAICVCLVGWVLSTLTAVLFVTFFS